jgi:hypothetical protein
MNVWHYCVVIWGTSYQDFYFFVCHRLLWQFDESHCVILFSVAITEHLTLGGL